MACSRTRMTIEEIEAKYPLHLLVWDNQYEKLNKLLTKGVTAEELEKIDARGRTPLMLAVTLGYLESARVLVDHGADIKTENKEGWTVVQEAVATGDPELVQLILERRDYQRLTSRVGGVPDLLLKLKEAPDFYVEMKWEFTSWVPLVSRMCPSDTYRVYKQGSKVRIDTTLLGFEQNNWQRGNTSFIFQGQNESATLMEVDHETNRVFVEQMRTVAPADLSLLQPSPETVSARLTTPIVTTYIDTDKISFERNKSGMWSWRQDKTETINGHDCKVFGASNVELITKTRAEHLSDADKQRMKGAKTPLQSFLGIAETEERAPTPHEEYSHQGNPCHIEPEEYFDENVDLDGKDIGRPKEMTTKIQKFKATLWLCENYPLSLQEQIIPIVDLMAISSSHFAKLKDFIQMQLPSGFPVKIEIPLFHVLNARITFGNIFAMDEPVPGVTMIDTEERPMCVVDDSCFIPPANYTVMGAESRRQVTDDQDDLLPFAIRQSLLDAGSDDQVDIWEALNVQRPTTPEYLRDEIRANRLLIDDEERELQRAIQASLKEHPPTSFTSQTPHGIEEISELSAAIELSVRQIAEEESLRRKEEETLEQVLKLSLTEK
nr:PREDICTED: ankyrin repeat domain-containing protein 13B [Bemisia tabaci]